MTDVVTTITRTFTLLLFLGIIVGCSSENPKEKALESSSKSPKEKALESFKEVIRNLKTACQEADMNVSKFTFDVRETDSLVSPFTATLSFEQEKQECVIKWVCQFARQDEVWVHKNIDHRIIKKFDENSCIAVGMTTFGIDKFLTEITGAPSIVFETKQEEKKGDEPAK